MYKKIIKNILLFLIMFCGFNVSVKAFSIYDYLKSGDIIIGNTTFRNGTWISATRASKAGSLYTLNNGDTDVRTFKYINPSVWYEMDPVTDKYKVLSEGEINELEDFLYINYLNNEPLTKIYKSAIIEEDEFSGGPNYVYNFFNELYGDIFVEDSEVILDYDNETITCPFNKSFEFKVVSNNTPIYYNGYCGSEFEFFPLNNGEIYNPNINIISSKLAEDEAYLNQNKVTLNNDFNNSSTGEEIYYPPNYISFKINEKFERFSLNEYSEKSKYLVFDFEIEENQDTNNIRDIISYDDNYEYEIIDENTFRLFVEINDRFERNSQQYFLLDVAGEYVAISLNYEGLELSDKDFEVTNLTLADIDVEGNNQGLVDDIKYEEIIYTDEDGYSYKDKYYSINTLGNLNHFDYNDYHHGSWLAFKLELDSDIYLDEIEITSVNDFSYFYEIVNNSIILWVDAESIYYGYSINFYYPYTNGNGNDRIELKINNYSEDMMINYDKEILDFYQAHIYTDEEIISKLEPITNYSYNYGDLYYNENQNKLYFKEDATAIFRDEESFKMFALDNDAIWLRELVGIMCKIYPSEGDKEESGGVSQYFGLADSDYDSFEWLDNYVDSEDGATYILYYFFNRDKTESELETISTLEDLGVKLVDLSDYYYGEE